MQYSSVQGKNKNILDIIMVQYNHSLDLVVVQYGLGYYNCPALSDMANSKQYKAGQWSSHTIPKVAGGFCGGRGTFSSVLVQLQLKVKEQ